MTDGWYKSFQFPVILLAKFLVDGLMAKWKHATLTEGSLFSTDTGGANGLTSVVNRLLTETLSWYWMGENPRTFDKTIETSVTLTTQPVFPFPKSNDSNSSHAKKHRPFPRVQASQLWPFYRCLETLIYAVGWRNSLQLCNKIILTAHLSCLYNDCDWISSVASPLWLYWPHCS